uniref:F-box domain-containing protein n=1 Tax=Rhizophagus irregularis (strain DAOM 181602 / DAOM 197198 / MUCL 43194) TaxID=747089 RepID=U9T9D3_RHIID
MAKLNKDILFLIFEELQEDSKSLFSCLMVNRLWCETVVPILWRNPWCYKGINYRNKNSLFIIISHYLIDDIKEFITIQRIQLPSYSNQSLLFDYLSFCRSINVDTINNIISIGSSLPYNQFFMQQEFYSLFMRKCPELKYFDMKSIKHQIFYFPEAMVRLESLCELQCDTIIDSSYFYGLSQLCQYIQRLLIINNDSKPNHGIIKLIEVQKKLKHFEWDDDFDDDFTDYDPYEELILTLEKKAESLNYLRIIFLYSYDYDHILLQDILSKFNKLKVLIIGDYTPFNEEQLEKLKIQVYCKLEVLNIEQNKLSVISSIIENSGGCLKKVLFSPYNIKCERFNFNEDSLINFIRKIYENCPSIEYLSIAFSPLKEHFIELEKLLKICKNLKSLLLVVIFDNEKDTYENSLKNGEELLNILIRSAPTNFKEIRFCHRFKFSLEILEEFLEKWRGRHAISLFTTEYLGIYKELTNKYKRDGVIKEYKYLPYVDLTEYIMEVCY